MGRLGLALLTLLGCEQATAGERLLRALKAADAGDPGAWDLCLEVEIGQGRGECKVSASRSMSDERRALACEDFVRVHWRNECFFQFAEDLGRRDRWDEAITRCGQADTYAGACARHLWWLSQLDGQPDPELYVRLTNAFPSERYALGLRDENMLRIGADAREQAAAVEAGLDQAQRIASTEALRVWETKLRAGEHVDSSACPEADRAGCLSAVRAIYTDRWHRTLERSPTAEAALCDGVGHLGPRLATGGDPELEAALAALRAEQCTSR